jgi:hypothetical protein
VHYSEVSKLETPGLYPLYDLTASGLVDTVEAIGANANRVGRAVRAPNFGMVVIDWTAADVTIDLQLLDHPGRVQSHHIVRLSELQLPAE